VARLIVPGENSCLYRLRLRTSTSTACVPAATSPTLIPFQIGAPLPSLIPSVSKSPCLAPPKLPSNTFPSPSRRHGLELITRLNPAVPAKTVTPRSPSTPQNQQPEPQERDQARRLTAQSPLSPRFLHRLRRRRVLQLNSRPRVSTTSNPPLLGSFPSCIITSSVASCGAHKFHPVWRMQIDRPALVSVPSRLAASV
jgi:hypothetical protein